MDRHELPSVAKGSKWKVEIIVYNQNYNLTDFLKKSFVLQIMFKCVSQVDILLLNYGQECCHWTWKAEVGHFIKIVFIKYNSYIVQNMKKCLNLSDFLYPADTMTLLSILVGQDQFIWRLVIMMDMCFCSHGREGIILMSFVSFLIWLIHLSSKLKCTYFLVWQRGSK